MGCRNK